METYINCSYAVCKLAVAVQRGVIRGASLNGSAANGQLPSLSRCCSFSLPHLNNDRSTTNLHSCAHSYDVNQSRCSVSLRLLCLLCPTSTSSFSAIAQMSFLFGAGASLLSAASQQLASYFEYEVEQAELADQQHQHYQHQHQPAPHQSPPRRISLPSHHLLSSPSLPTPPHSTTLLSSPTHSLISTSALFDHSTHSTYSQPTCTCTTAHSTATDYTLTAFTVEFAAALSEHPSTFHGFPACCEWSDRFHLSAVQLVHARRLLSECGAFGELRRRVREEWAVSEFEFWRVYFLLRINVNTREREQRRRQRCSPQEARRRSARGEDGLERNKENVRPTSGSNKDKLVQARGDVHGAKGRSTQQQYQKEEVEEEEEVVDEASADGVECVAEKQEEQRYEQQRTIWSEVDRLMLTLASVRPQPSASSAPTTPSKATLLVTALQLSPASVNDSACSDRYASPEPAKALWPAVPSTDSRRAADGDRHAHITDAAAETGRGRAAGGKQAGVLSHAITGRFIE